MGGSYHLLRARTVAAGAFFLLLSGCIFDCKSCQIETGYAPPPATAAPAGLPVEEVDIPEPRPDTEPVRSAAIPQIPTAVLVMQELNAMLTELSAMIDQAGGEVKSIIQQTQTTASQLLAEMDYTLGERAERTIDQLEGAEKRMVEDAQALTAQMKRSADLINAGLLESAKESLWESDILAYNALYSLPCRDKIPRLVYAKPRKMRIWADPGEPGGQEFADRGASQELAIPVRGNFLKIVNERPPVVTARVGTDGAPRPAAVGAINQNGFTVGLGDETVQELQSIRRPTRLYIDASMMKCLAEDDEYSEERSGVDVEVLPPLTYSVATSITPVVMVPSAGTKTMSFFERGSNKCNDNYRADRLWSVGPPATVTDWRISVTSANGGSHVIRTSRSGPYTVSVEARVRGAGRDCFAGFCNCKGRGWLGYTLAIDYETMVETPLRQMDFASTAVQPAYVFSYPLTEFPARHEKKACRYYSRIAINEGDQQTIVELTDTNPVVDTSYGPISSRVSSECQVTIDMPPQAVANIRRVA